VRNNDDLDRIITSIAEKHERLDGVIAAAAIQKVRPATQWLPDDVREVLDINYTGAFMTCLSGIRHR
jgi:NAD(P)-dependent dehydrogenase (short-subunit alcohol dehydrogenase family)